MAACVLRPSPGPWAAKRVSGKVATSRLNLRTFSDTLLSCTLSRKVLLCAPTRGRTSGVCLCSSCHSLTGFPATWVNLQVRHCPTPRASPAGTEKRPGQFAPAQKYSTEAGFALDLDDELRPLLGGSAVSPLCLLWCSRDSCSPSPRFLAEGPAGALAMDVAKVTFLSLPSPLGVRACACLAIIASAAFSHSFRCPLLSQWAVA